MGSAATVAPSHSSWVIEPLCCGTHFF
jgi:hypothetical protein